MCFARRLPLMITSFVPMHCSVNVRPSKRTNPWVSETSASSSTRSFSVPEPMLVTRLWTWNAIGFLDPGAW